MSLNTEFHRFSYFFSLLKISMAGIFVCGMPTTRAVDPSTNSTAEIIQVHAYHDRGEFDGVVLVAEADKVQCLEGIGQVSAAPDAAPLTAQTVFPVCSITKQFTAVLTLQLVDAGKLRLDSTLGEVLPAFRTDEAGKAITVRQLLLHTSGLPDFDTVLPEEEGGMPGFYRLPGLDFTDPIRVLSSYAGGPLLSAPGEKFNYNNADYWVLGVIIERLAGKSYDTLLGERFFGPLGMTHTGLCTPTRPLPPDAAQGKSPDPQDPKKPRPATFVRLQNFWAAGAAFSTAEDLLRWSVALDEGRLLSPAMFTPDPKLGFAALSTWVYNTKVPGMDGKIQLAERQGEIAGWHALSLRLPQQHGHIILLSNLETADLNSTYMQKGMPFELVRAFLTSGSGKL